MDVVSIEGSAPGRVMATVSHGGDIRLLSMEVSRDPAGGWRARCQQSWTPRCHAIVTAVLLEASESFAH